MFKEFKEFAVRGNVVDMAVGIVIGLAFGRIVNSLVNDILMPPIGMLLDDVDFTDLFITLSGPAAETLAQAQEAGAVTINYGVFINSIVHFLIVAFAVFILVRQINRFRRKEEAAPTPPAEPPRQEALLEEIRDLLRERRVS